MQLVCGENVMDATAATAAAAAAAATNFFAPSSAPIYSSSSRENCHKIYRTPSAMSQYATNRNGFAAMANRSLSISPSPSPNSIDPHHLHRHADRQTSSQHPVVRIRKSLPITETQNGFPSPPPPYYLCTVTCCDSANCTDPPTITTTINNNNNSSINHINNHQRYNGGLCSKQQACTGADDSMMMMRRISSSASPQSSPPPLSADVTFDRTRHHHRISSSIDDRREALAQIDCAICLNQNSGINNINTGQIIAAEAATTTTTTTTTSTTCATMGAAISSKQTGKRLFPHNQLQLFCNLPSVPVEYLFDNNSDHQADTYPLISATSAMTSDPAVTTTTASPLLLSHNSDKNNNNNNNCNENRINNIFPILKTAAATTNPTTRPSIELSCDSPRFVVSSSSRQSSERRKKLLRLHYSPSTIVADSENRKSPEFASGSSASTAPYSSAASASSSSSTSAPSPPIISGNISSLSSASHYPDYGAESRMPIICATDSMMIGDRHHDSSHRFKFGIVGADGRGSSSKGIAANRGSGGPNYFPVYFANADKHGFFRKAVPALPIAIAVLFCICNLVVPGSGTLLASLTIAMGSPTEYGPGYGCRSFFICFLSALLQFATAIFVFGWVWSIMWGIVFIKNSLRYGERRDIHTMSLC